MFGDDVSDHTTVSTSSATYQCTIAQQAPGPWLMAVSVPVSVLQGLVPPVDASRPVGEGHAARGDEKATRVDTESDIGHVSSSTGAAVLMSQDDLTASETQHRLSAESARGNSTVASALGGSVLFSKGQKVNDGVGTEKGAYPRGRGIRKGMVGGGGHEEVLSLPGRNAWSTVTCSAALPELGSEGLEKGNGPMMYNCAEDLRSVHGIPEKCMVRMCR